MNIKHNGYRIFTGDETNQVECHPFPKPANPTSWYFEPLDYEGDTLWSQPFTTSKEAMAAVNELSSVGDRVYGGSGEDYDEGVILEFHTSELVTIGWSNETRTTVNINTVSKLES
jgi:hypothetical protein